MTQKEYLMQQHRWLVRMRKYQDARWLLNFLIKRSQEFPNFFFYVLRGTFHTCPTICIPFVCLLDAFFLVFPYNVIGNCVMHTFKNYAKSINLTQRDIKYEFIVVFLYCFLSVFKCLRKILFKLSFLSSLLYVFRFCSIFSLYSVRLFLLH